MELHSANQIQVVPIFYGVKPSNVRNQTGSFAAAFQEYEELGKAPERVSQWRRALNQVGHLSGFDSSTCPDEAAMVSDIVRSISSQLLDMRQPSGVDLVGMETHMVKMHFLLNMASEDEVRMVGIWGMGGVGKSTIAKYLYDRISRQFPAHYFIDDIKKNYKDRSTSNLQQSFLSTILSGQHIGFRSDEAGSEEIKARLGHQKVLLILDGVDKAEQVHALAREKSWFGPGSRIIITTRDRGLLNSCGANNVHEVKCLDDKDALQVFKKLAFRGGSPPSIGIQQLFIRASRLAHGLPSALVAYASYLCENETIERWEEEIGILETRPHKNVEEILRYSYDGLDDQDKVAFLQVACLFNGYPFNHVTSLLDDGRPKMNHLTAKAIISITTDGCINMHVLIVQTGRAIVRQESRNMPSRQRFLWDNKDIYDVLNRNIGTEETEGVALSMCEMTDKLYLSSTVFNAMHSIKFLKFFQNLSDAESSVQLGKNGFIFPRNLRLLHWDAYPLQTMPWLQGYYHLVHLNLRSSNLSRLWDRTVELLNLRRLDVTGSKNLKEFPDFSTARKLEELIIEGCLRLQEIPNKSLPTLRRLTKLNALHCNIFRGDKFSVDLNYWRKSGSRLPIRLMFLDKEMWFNFLTDLSIEGQICIEFVDLSGNAEHLSFGSGSKQQIPDQMISMKQETFTTQLVPCPLSWKSLEIMRFSYKKDGKPFLCKSFQTLPCLTELKLINLNIRYIPANISNMQFLEKLDLSGNDFKHLPFSMGSVARLKYLSLRNCRNLWNLPQIDQVETLVLSGCVNLAWLAPGGYTNCLTELWLDNCNNVKSLSYQLHHFTKLTYLNISRNDLVSVPGIIRQLSSLETLFLDNCKELRSVEVHQLPESLKYLYAHGCDSLEKVSLPPNHSIKHLDLNHCPLLNRVDHNHLMRLAQKGSRQCVCLPENGGSSDSDSKPTDTSTMINRTGKILRSLKSVLTEGFSSFFGSSNSD